MPALVVGASGVLMVGGLGAIERIIFDEVYYVNDARDLLEFGVEQGFVVHPQLGKMLIAVSIWLFGDGPFGWRAFGGIAGVLTVWLTYLTGLRLFGRMVPAALAALLVAIDGVFLVQMRTAMLDPFLALFTMLGAWALVTHVQRTRDADLAWLADDPGPHDRLPRRDVTFLLVAGVAFGLAIGTKWSGLLGLGGGGLVMIGAELARRRRVLGSPWRRLGRGVALLATTLVLLPAATYLLTWTPWFLEFADSYEGGQTCEDDEDCAATPLPSRVAALGRFHGRILEFHLDLEAEHGYRAPAYTWPLQARPVVYYYETCSEDRFNRVPSTNDDGEEEIPEPCVVERNQAAEMLAVGNPALWWGFLPAAAVLVGGLVRRERMAAVPMAFVAAQYLPWLIVSRPVFSFYAVPLVPFVALGMAAAIARLGDRRPTAAALAGGVAGGAATAALTWLFDLMVGDPTVAAYGLVTAGGVAAGAAIGTWAFPSHRPRPSPWSAPGWSRAATWTTVVLVVAAVGLAVYFLPIWLGVPLHEDVIRQRWWFRGWI